MVVVLDSYITTIDIELIGLKVIVRMITFVKKCFPLIILKTGSYRAFIFHMVFYKGLTLIDFVFFT